MPERIPSLKAFDKFVERLKNHDWFYAMSDDHRTWRAGRTAEELLTQDSNANIYFRQAFRTWSEYISDSIRGVEQKSILEHRRELVIKALRDGIQYDEAHRAQHEGDFDDTVPHHGVV